MTTAARPTFEPARGGRGKGENDLSALSKQYSSRDLPSHTKLKYRQTGQATSEELQARNFRRELEEKEQVSRQKREREKSRSFTEAPAISSSHSKRARLEPPPASIDADDPVDDEDDEEDSDDSDDDTAELLKELQKIRRERREEQEKKEQERREEEERIRTENLLKGNPLLNQQSGNFKVKRRWDDDVVFKNCARQEPKNKERHFINDTIRSEFHKKFMDKYVK